MAKSSEIILRGSKRPLTSLAVARMAGVAPSTVSRVLNRVDGISSKTRRRVLEVVRATGYRPSAAASSLSRQKHETIGLITEIASDNAYYGPQLIRGVSNELAVASMRMAISSVLKGSNIDSIEALPLFLSHSVDGFILDLHAATGDVQAMADRLVTPYVMVNPPRPMTNNAIIPNDIDAAEQATNYLIQRGHRKIGYIPSTEISRLSSQSDRMQGYQRSMTSAGLTPIPLWDVPMTKTQTRMTPEDYIPRLQDYLKNHGCTAVVTYHAPAAARVLSACYLMGVRVPQELSIVACDYDPILEYTPVTLTSLHLDRNAMGELAVRQVLQQINQSVSTIPSVIVKGQLQERNSVATLG